MRITGGTALNRRLKTPGTGRTENVRPTSDRVREALFSILGKSVQDSRVLDLFAGTGALGIEALSRGASSAVFVDHHPRSIDLIRTNILTCLNHADVTILRLDLSRKSSYYALTKRLKDRKPFDLIFLDPPYKKKLAEKALTMVEKAELLSENGLVIVEENADVNLPEKIGSLVVRQKRTYGKTGIWLYSAEV